MEKAEVIARRKCQRLGFDPDERIPTGSGFQRIVTDFKAEVPTKARWEMEVDDIRWILEQSDAIDRGS